MVRVEGCWVGCRVGAAQGGGDKGDGFGHLSRVEPLYYPRSLSLASVVADECLSRAARQTLGGM